MAGLRRILGRVARTPGVRTARVVSGRIVTPEIRDQLKMMASADADMGEHITTLYHRSLDDNHRLTTIEAALERIEGQVADLVANMPTVLNAIASTNGTARLLRRELDAALAASAGHDEHFAKLDSDVQRLEGHVRDELWPLAAKVQGYDGLSDSVAWLLTRVETIRAEAMHEIRYGAGAAGTERSQPQVEVVNPSAIVEGDVRLNLGCGHLPIEGYVNVDMRPLPGVDVVAPVDSLPFEAGSVREIFSAHVLEHFPQEQLQRVLIPYWRSLLADGGTFRAVVPDLEAMMRQYVDEEITFENLREVAYGGQEYEGDFHHTAFTPDSLSALLAKAGFDKIELIERGRPNGICLEFELSARRAD